MDHHRWCRREREPRQRRRPYDRLLRHHRRGREEPDRELHRSGRLGATDRRLHRRAESVHVDDDGAVDRCDRDQATGLLGCGADQLHAQPADHDLRQHRQPGERDGEDHRAAARWGPVLQGAGQRRELVHATGLELPHRQHDPHRRVPGDRPLQPHPDRGPGRRQRLRGQGRPDRTADRHGWQPSQRALDPGTGVATATIPDSGTLADGTYQLQALVWSLAGNEATITQGRPRRRRRWPPAADRYPVARRPGSGAGTRARCACSARAAPRRTGPAPGSAANRPALRRDRDPPPAARSSCATGSDPPSPDCSRPSTAPRSRAGPSRSPNRQPDGPRSQPGSSRPTARVASRTRSQPGLPGTVKFAYPGNAILRATSGSTSVAVTGQSHARDHPANRGRGQAATDERHGCTAATSLQAESRYSSGSASRTSPPRSRSTQRSTPTPRGSGARVPAESPGARPDIPLLRGHRKTVRLAVRADRFERRHEGREVGPSSSVVRRWCCRSGQIRM